MQDIEWHIFSTKDGSKVEKKEETEKAADPEVVKAAWDEINKDEIRFKPLEPEEKRIVDIYSKDEIGEKVDHYLAHSAARGVKPSTKLLVDWLYSTKRPTETDDFVKIERLVEMLKEGIASPLIIAEVLHYASNVEKAAIEVYDELFFLSKRFKSMEHLEKALNVRLKVREEEKSVENNGTSSNQPPNSIMGALNGKIG